MKEYDDLPDSVKDLDKPFEWHRLEEYGLPWEASVFLLEMWATEQERRVSRTGGLTMPPPTVRQVRWWWRVHLSVPDMQMSDVWWLAQRFVSRELAHDWLGAPLEMADLEAHLAYKPWISQERHQLYLQAVEEKRIPPLRHHAQILQDAIAIGARTKAVSDFLLTLASAGIPLDYPELLHSQQITLLMAGHRGSEGEQMATSIRLQDIWDKLESGAVRSKEQHT